MTKPATKKQTKAKSPGSSDIGSCKAEIVEEVPPAEAPAGPFVTVIKTAGAAKLSPRGEGEIIYMVGVLEGKVFLRIADNSSGGRHSKEWLPVEAIRKSFTTAMLTCQPFKSHVFAEAFKGKSNNNSGFLIAILRVEQVLVGDKEKKGMTVLAAQGALEKWERGVLALPIPKDAQRLPLHPPKPVNLFKKKDDSGSNPPETDDAPEEVDSGDSGEDEDEE